MTSVRFKSKRDRSNLVWLAGISLIAALAWLPVLLGHWPWYVPLPTIAMVATPVIQWLATHYTISPGRLTVRAGLNVQTVPLAEIQAAHRLRGSLWNVHGHSVDQVAIVYGRTIRRTLRISPTDPDRFIAVLQALCPQLAAATPAAGEAIAAEAGAP